MQLFDFEDLNYELHDSEITKIILPPTEGQGKFSMTCVVSSDDWERPVLLKTYEFEANSANLEDEVDESDLLGYAVVELRLDVFDKKIFFGTTLRSFQVNFVDIQISTKDHG